MAKLTINDATKDELITYFFQPDCFGGGFRIPAAKDSFLLWLKQKRDGALLAAGEEATEATIKALHEYMDCIHRANDEPDIEKKLAILEEGNQAYARYEKFDKQRKALDKKLINGENAIYG